MHISIFSGHIVLSLCNPQFLTVSTDWQNAPTSQPLHWEYGNKGIPSLLEETEGQCAAEAN